MIYQIYRITNLINNKIYIGQHSCSCKECSYVGSGRNIIKAFKKYGSKNFKKEILFSFDSFEEMNKKEAEIVNEEFVARKDTYNIQLGGSFGKHSQETKIKMSNAKIGSKHSPETKMKMSKSLKHRVVSQETKQKLSKAATGKCLSHETKNKLSEFRKGILPSEKTKAKMAEKRKIKQRISWGNKDVLKIDPSSDEVIERYYYAADSGFCTSNIKTGIENNKIRYGYKWKIDDQ